MSIPSGKFDANISLIPEKALGRVKIHIIDPKTSKVAAEVRISSHLLANVLVGDEVPCSLEITEASRFLGGRRDLMLKAIPVGGGPNLRPWLSADETIEQFVERAITFETASGWTVDPRYRLEADIIDHVNVVLERWFDAEGKSIVLEGNPE